MNQLCDVFDLSLLDTSIKTKWSRYLYKNFRNFTKHQGKLQKRVLMFKCQRKMLSFQLKKLTFVLFKGDSHNTDGRRKDVTVGRFQ